MNHEFHKIMVMRKYGKFSCSSEYPIFYKPTVKYINADKFRLPRVSYPEISGAVNSPYTPIETYQPLEKYTKFILCEITFINNIIKCLMI